ncbi:SGNH/GDSL hydrolase family protein [Kutzneria kofuensis]
MVVVGVVATTFNASAAAHGCAVAYESSSQWPNGVTCTGGVTATPTVPSSSSPTPTGVLSQVQTAGRVKVANDAVQYSWPGVYFEGRFRGTGVGLVLNDSASDYDIQVDGATVATLVKPGRTTRWITNLPNGEHSVRLVKRNDSPWATSAFGGLVAAPGGSILSPPAARRRQIEFIGDSLTVGYGNLSTTRTCTGDQLALRTNTDVSYGALAARHLDADYQVNAYSGLGMVRNYNGGSPSVNYRTYYDRALLNVNGDVWQKPATWQPQVVVIHLGTNDFSTPVNGSEQWTPDSLAAAYRAAYIAFIGKLRARYDPTTMIVVAGTKLFGDQTRQVVQAVNSRGDSRVRHWQLDEAGLDLRGCDWHYSAHDDQLIATQLGTFLGTLPLTW